MFLYIILCYIKTIKRLEAANRQTQRRNVTQNNLLGEDLILNFF